MKRIHRTLTAAALAGSLALGGTAVASAQIPAPAVFELDGTTYQRQADGSYKSTNPLGSVSLTAEQAQAAWERLQEKEAPADNPAEDPAAPVDPDPQDNAPSAEEKAASEQMLKENKDEVITQGGQVAESTAEKSQVQSRGISAETGSNTVARGLAALAIAAMIAAGAFAARRKFFI